MQPASRQLLRNSWMLSNCGYSRRDRLSLLFPYGEPIDKSFASV